MSDIVDRVHGVPPAARAIEEAAAVLWHHDLDELRSAATTDRARRCTDAAIELVAAVQDAHR